MAGSTFFKGLAVWFAGFVALALVVGGVAGLAFLSEDRSPPPTDDLHVHNGDDASHSVRIEFFPENGSDAVFSELADLDPNETVSFENATEHGESYRLVISVDDRESKSFDAEGPDGLCTMDVWVENATVETGMSCA